MKKSIFILGPNGNLGSALKKFIQYNCKKKFILKTIGKKFSNYNINLENFRVLKKILINNKIDILVNCAAHTNLKICEKSYKKIYKINVLLPEMLSKLSLRHHFKLIHISSDSIYSSKIKKKLNKETDEINYCNNYSKSKYFAEKKMIKNKNNLILRSNFISMRKKSFPNWLLDKINNQNKINLFHDFYTSSLDLHSYVKILVKIFDHNLSGVYNLGSKNTISKLEFAKKFSKKLNKKLNYKSLSANDKSVLKRNLNIGMNVSKIEKKIGIKIIKSNQVINNLLK